MAKEDDNNSQDRDAERKAAGGWPALRSAARHLLSSGKPVRGARTLLNLNQPDGFDCPGCAWGDPEHGSSFEFCENGVKAVAWEATSARAAPEFFAKHSVSELRGWSDYELEQQGRLTEPLRYDPESDRYVAVTWEKAFEGIASGLNALESPNQAEFYTSGRASNEAAFLYQTFVRLFGTNNFPDCSHMCHEASGVALTEAIGIGKGTVLLEDFEKADAIFVVGQNPGTNHPRMLTALREATARGARVVVINPLKERGLKRFADPQNALEMLNAGSKATSTDYLCPRIGGDMAVFRGLSKAVLDADRASRNAGGEPVVDQAFIDEHTAGFDDYVETVEATSWAAIENQSGVHREDLERIAKVYLESDRVITTWAMGITQHRHAVKTIREMTCFSLLRGNIGRPGAGLCPVRGHSNVQGDRTVGINETAPAALLDAMEAEFGVPMPREPGHNVLQAIGAMLNGEARAFIALGGNFARATPDSQLIQQAMSQLDLTVNIATKLNHSHLLPGKTSFILPCLGRTEIDRNAAGDTQIVTVEDSMSMVHGSAGFNLPASKSLKSEIAIVAGIAAATVGSDLVDWHALAEDYDRIRDVIARVLPAFGDFNRNVRQPRGFRLRNSASEREWNTGSGRANFHAAALPEQTEWQETSASNNRFVLQTVRSHDQFNTTVYGMEDRYRGVSGERDVVFIRRADMKRLGASPGDRVDLIGVSDDNVERVAENFKLISYDIPRGCLAGYYPELNVLVPHHAHGEKSFTPASKAIKVELRLRRDHG